MTGKVYVGAAKTHGVGFRVEEHKADSKLGATILKFLGGLVILTIFVGATVLANILTDKIQTWTWCTAHPTELGCINLNR